MFYNQAEALRRLQRTYFVNKHYDEEMDVDTQDAIVNVLDAFDFSLECKHDEEDMLDEDGVGLECPICGYYEFLEDAINA
jgi:hypothetical protein